MSSEARSKAGGVLSPLAPVAYGSLGSGMYWLQNSDGRLFQIDGETKAVVERLSRGEPWETVEGDCDVNREEVEQLASLLGARESEPFFLVCADGGGTCGPTGLSNAEDGGQSTAPEAVTQYRFRHLSAPWFPWVLAAMLAAAVSLQGLFIWQRQFAFVNGLAGQWIVTALLTAAVLFHELGHYLAMPKHAPVSASLHWSGPLPVFSLVCNEAWKLGRTARIRIDLAGFVFDLLLSGAAAGIGIASPDTAPWVWTFLLVQWFRMLLAVMPLLPGDGYWLLVDLLNRPNLFKQAVQSLLQLKLSWLSLYALLRYAFLAYSWAFLFYFMYGLAVRWMRLPLIELLTMLLQPGILLLLLSLAGLMYSMLAQLIGRVRSAHFHSGRRKAEQSSPMNNSTAL